MFFTLRKVLVTLFTVVTMLCFVSVSVSAPASSYSRSAAVETMVPTLGVHGELSVNSDSFEKSDESSQSRGVITNTASTSNSELEELSPIGCMVHRADPTDPRCDQAASNGMESTMLRGNSGYLASIFRPPDVTSC